VDRLLDQARNAPDAAARRAALAEAERLLVTDQPMIPLFTPIRWSMVDPNVLGWSDNAVAQHPLAALSVIGASQGLLSGSSR
jgi:ABC-type oligopeptide transport system substrate-binding subunit